MSEEDKNTESLSDNAANQPEGAMKPILLKLKKGGKKSKKKDDSGKKARYTGGLKGIQEFDGKLVSIAKKTTKALSKGVDVYDREREQSSMEKKDGAIEDFIHNTAKASSAALKEAADIPIDIAEAISPVSFRKRLRRPLRRVSKYLRLWRI
jgi:hypothetical protein